MKTKRTDSLLIIWLAQGLTKTAWY